ncbi:MAG: Glycosyl transferase family 2 [Microgenomates group bacterium GW2011_GWC1_43_13]|nr:MAG: Glycosyl transferase family 2 [Microgenomates group bacterium GW2011_GWC1_43_13]
MNTKPLFLIVTPSFNQAQFIAQTIESVISQTGDFEIFYVVMDGGSSDSTVQILKNYQQRISKKKPASLTSFDFQTQKDKGQTDAINKGIRFLDKQLEKRKITSDQLVIFAYLNSDDYYLSTAFIQVVKAFQKDQSKKWLVADSMIVNQKGSPIQNVVRLYKQTLRRIYQQFPSLLFVLNPLPQPSTFIRYQAIKKIGQFNVNLRFVMDYQYWLRMQKEFGLPILLNTTLSAFRIHSLSKGGSQFTKQFEEQFEVAQEFCHRGAFLLLHQAHNWVTTTIYQFLKQ